MAAINKIIDHSDAAVVYEEKTLVWSGAGTYY
jgi:hypothetical protein